MHILITGGAGFIGTNLIPKLRDAGHTVTVIDNMSHGTYVPEIHDAVNFVNADCIHKEAISKIVSQVKPDATFMFHGLVSIYDCHRDPQKAITNNLIGSANVFDALIEHGCPRVIFAETSAVYENDPLPIKGYSEETSDPTTMYAVTKAALLLMAKSYSRTRGLKFTALRYFNVAGAMQDYRRTVPPLFAGFALRMIGGNEPIIFGDGNRKRDFIHVDDINDFHLQCLTDDRTVNQVFNLGRGEAISLHDVGYLVAMILNESGKYPKIDMDIQYKQMPQINGEAFEIRSNISKATALGWSPTKTIRRALEDTIRYLEKQIEDGFVDPKTFMNDVKIEDVKIG